MSRDTTKNLQHDLKSLDFSFGDPYEMPPPGFVEALQRWSVPQNSSWYGYKGNIPESRVAVSAALQDKRGLSIFWTLDKLRRKII